MKINKLGIVSVVTGIALFATATESNAQTYNPTTDFSSSSNPTGVWSYGYSHPVGPPAYTFTLFNTESGGAGVVDAWSDSTYDTLGTPSVVLNNSGTSEDGVAPGQLSLNPGPVAGGDYAIVRFTAPTAATYDVTGQFYAGDSGAMDGYIVLAGDLASPLQTFVNTTNSSTFTPFAETMTAGETLDFVVGNNDGSFYSGNTPLSVVITTVPEPDTYALMLAGLGLVAVGARRRKWQQQ